METVVGVETRMNQASGKEYALVTTDAGKYAVFGYNVPKARQLQAGTQIEAEVEEGPKGKKLQGWKVVGQGAVPTAAAFKGFVKQVTRGPEITKDTSVLARYILDTRVAGKKREEAVKMVMESLEDGADLAEQYFRRMADRTRAQEADKAAIRVGINPGSTVWKDYLQRSYGTEIRWEDVLTTLGDVEGGRRKVQMTPDNKLAFV